MYLCAPKKKNRERRFESVNYSHFLFFKMILMGHYFSCWRTLSVVWLCSSLASFWIPGSIAQKNDVDLPFGDINVVALTDVHSWVGGHGSNEPDENADYGEVLSFYQRLQDHCSSRGMDLWFVVNGDWIDGTGLSLNGNIEHLTPLLEKMPWDALNVGNHEIYSDKVVTESLRPGGFVEWWGDKYLSSNVLHAQQDKPLGKRYRFLKGKNSTVLTFGFLYNMKDYSSVVHVEEVQTVVEEKWFTDVVANEQYDAILVLAHMDVRDALVSVMLNKIRSLVGGSMPVQFITGHTHYRGVQVMDEASVSFEAGRYLDTIGFVSFPKQETLLKAAGNRKLQQNGGDSSSSPLLGPGGTEWPNATGATANTNNNETVSSPTPLNTETTAGPTQIPSTFNGTSNMPTIAPKEKEAPLFHYRFIDTSVTEMESILGVTDMSTDAGTSLSHFIQRTRSEMGLLELVGCSPQSYYLNRTIDEADSVWRLFLQEIAPSELLQMPADASPNRSKIFLGGAGGLRYDLIGRTLTKDDVIAVSPFNETIFAVGPKIPGWALTQLITQVLNKDPSADNPKWPAFVMSPSLDEIDSNVLYEIMVPEWGLSDILDGLEKAQYNGTVDKMPTEMTTTQLWLNFVKNNWICKDNEIKEHNNNNQLGGSHGSSGGNSKVDGTPTSPYQHPGSEEDQKLFIMAMVAVVCVLVLGTLYIWQLHKSWLSRYRNRQLIIFEADAEFIGDDENELI